MLKPMNFRTALAAVTLPALLAASVTFAQSTETEEPAQTPAVDQDLNLGELASETPQVGQTYIKEESGDWTIRCVKRADDSDPCEMFQMLTDEQGTPIAEFALFRLATGGQAAAGATVIAPLETSLQNQLMIQVDNNPARRYPFAFCNQVGCYARIGLTDADVASYKAGNAAKITIVPMVAPDQNIDVTLSLSGFTAGFDKTSIIER